MPRSVIEHQTPDQRAIRIRLVHHLHNLDHVQVDGFPESVDALGVRRRGRSLDSEDGIDDRSGQGGSQGRVKLGRQ